MGYIYLFNRPSEGDASKASTQSDTPRSSTGQLRVPYVFGRRFDMAEVSVMERKVAIGNEECAENYIQLYFTIVCGSTT